MPFAQNTSNSHDYTADLLWHNVATGQQIIWQMRDGVANGACALPPELDRNWKIAGTGDFNGDKELDVIWRHTQTGQNRLSLMIEGQIHSQQSFGSSMDSDWEIVGTGDFNGDRETDILWSNRTTGTLQLWLMNDTIISSQNSMTSLVGDPSWDIAATGDFDQDGSTDLLMNHTATGQVKVVYMNGEQVRSETLMGQLSTLNWEISGAGDFNRDGNTDLLMRDRASGQLKFSFMNGEAVQSETLSLSIRDQNWKPIILARSNRSSVVFEEMNFSGQEGDIGTLNVSLNEAISEDVTLTFQSGDFVTIDADTIIQNGTQTSITFTPQDWAQPKTFRFIAEKDGSSLDRPQNYIRYSLSGGTSRQGSYSIGRVENTYSPDNSKFNIDLDYRNDYSGFWTEARREVAQQAADDWAAWIGDELEGITLENDSIEMVDHEDKDFYFTANNFIDDLTVFMGAYDDADGAGGHAGKRVGGEEASSPLPRAGVVTIFTDKNTLRDESKLDTQFRFPSGHIYLGREALYSVVSHEIGHVLGLLGRNYYSEPFVSGTGASRVFLGPNSLAAYNSQPLPMQANESAHVEDEIPSIMSYGRSAQGIWQPTDLDKAILADSGYRVAGMQYIGNA